MEDRTGKPLHQGAYFSIRHSNIGYVEIPPSDKGPPLIHFQDETCEGIFPPPTDVRTSGCLASDLISVSSEAIKFVQSRLKARAQS